MAMDYTSFSRPGAANNAAGSDNYKDIFLKMFSGEVLESYEETKVMAPLVRSRTITEGE